MDDLTISIGTIANFDGLEDCLRTVFAEDDSEFTFRVNLVLNGSRDESRIQRIQQLFPTVRIILSHTKLGFCKCHNQTLLNHNSRYVLLLDDDTLIPKGTLPGMVRFMDAHPDVGVAGCKTIYPDGSFQKIFGLMPSPKTELLYALNISGFWPDHLYHDINGWKDVEWLNGHFMMVRSEVVRTVGALDEFYYTYVCEPDWCFRIHKAGWKVAYVPDVQITHIGGEHSTRGTYKKYTHILRAYINKYYFFSKHYSPLACFLLRPITMTGAALRLFKFLLLGVLSLERRAEALQKVQAYFRVILLGLSPSPTTHPEELRRENALAEEGL